MAYGVLLVVPALMLAYFGIVHYRDGMAVDAAIPVPVYMVAQVQIPKAAFVAAAEALAKADPRNGDAALAGAEAKWHAGEKPAEIIPLVRRGLTHEPASARGWTLYAEALTPLDKKQAAFALSQALMLAPRDYWLIGARATDAALIWPALDADSQAMALDQVRLMWQEPILHGQFRALLHWREGAALASRAFSQEDIHSINRWYSREQRRRQTP